MAEGSVSTDAIARALIGQCRREIEAGWAQVEAARDVLRRGRWMLARWEAQMRAHNTVAGFRMPKPKASYSGTLIPVEDDVDAGRHRPKRHPRREMRHAG